MIKVKGRKPMGRRKIEMKLIEDVDACHVCFSKRRQGIFKKANELSILCGAEVAIVVYSPAGKPYSFGHPSISVVSDRLLTGGGSISPHNHPPSQLPPPGNADQQAFNGRIGDMAATVEAAKKKRQELEGAVVMAMSAAPEGHLWDAKIEELGLQQLWGMMATLQRLQRESRVRANQSLIMADPLLCKRMINNLGFPMMENLIGTPPSTGSFFGLGFF